MPPLLAPMPLYARLARYLLLALLSCTAAWSARRFISDTDNVMLLVFFIWLCATIVGLYRRVAWGRFYVSCLSVMAAFLLTVSMIPFDHPGAADTMLHKMMMFSVAGAWLCVLAITILILMPAFLIGIRKDWFRNAWW